MRKGLSRLLLLDVNVLLALAWPNHQFHRAAVARLERSRERWATCAVTELGFIRLSSSPAVVGVSKSPAEAAVLLGALLQDSLHDYIETLPSPAGPALAGSFSRILGSKQVTDAYLLRLAAQQGARLLTFDTRLAALAQDDRRVEVLGG